MANKIRKNNGTFSENIIITQWVTNNVNKHKCNCGCGEFVNINRSHYRLGIPKYLHGHSGRHMGKIISSSLKAFYKKPIGVVNSKNILIL